MEKVNRERFEWLKQKHYELWDWLSKNPDNNKYDWFALDKNRRTIVSNSCFACQFDLEAAGDKPCTRCPIGSGKAVIGGSCLGGLYERYMKAKSNYRISKTSDLRAEVVELAKQIRDLPWSEEYVEDKEMNNENYIVINGKKAELTEEQLKQLGIEVGKNKRWRAEYKGDYFYVSTNNVAVSEREDNLEPDNFRYDTHNYFKTEEEAQKYAEVLEVKRQLMKFADEHNEKIDWDKLNEPKYYLYLTRPTDGIIISNTYRAKMPEIIYFSSTDIAQKAIDTIGAENIIKYLIYNY